MPRKLLVGGTQRNGSLKSATIKKVAPPTVPILPVTYSNRNSQISNPCICHEDHLGAVTPDCEDSVESHLTNHRQSKSLFPGNHYCSAFYNSQQQEGLLIKKMTSGSGAGSNGQIHLAHVIVHNQPDSLPVTPVEASHSPNLLKGCLISGSTQVEDQGIDVSSNSPGRHSPGGSSGGSSISRHSLSSLDSGRASAPGSEGKVINRRLSVHSYESAGSPQRRSYHSSSSSLASSGEDHATGTVLGQGPNVAEMVLHGLPDVEILSNWLASLHFEEYIPLFLQAGYDMPTITRMTPEDLTAIGITKPNHRRKMKSEIAKLNISDGIPEYKPNSLLEWLQLLRLEEYYATLCQQHYDTVDRVTDLTWEDLEEIGIQKLGHQKKILLAIKRIEDINQGRRPNLIPQSKANLSTDYQKSNNYSRPSTLSSVQPYHYPAQEVAIAMQRPKNSPSTDSIPEMKTFHQSTTREDDRTFISNASVLPAPLTSGLAPVHHQNGSVNPVLSPCRGRSLESLHPDDTIASLAMPQQPVVYQALSSNSGDHPKVPVPKDWKTTDLDNEYNYECEGTATLNRPKGFMKLRPVAKITAKTREEIAEVIMDIPDKEFKSLISQERTLDGWSSLDGSPRHGPLIASKANTLRRPPPPPPPKRSNSTKGERPPVEGKKEEAPSIKQRHPHLASASQWSSAQELHKTQESSEITSDDFPPPPSPLPSAVESDDCKNVQENEKTQPLEELFNNPLFRQKRKDSAGSSSSVDSSALPFANEAVGTIKQKGSKNYSTLQGDYLQRSSGKDRNGSRSTHEYDQTSEPMSPGDVIDDIEHMLANLSDQLDAMLDEEQVQK